MGQVATIAAIAFIMLPWIGCPRLGDVAFSWGIRKDVPIWIEGISASPFSTSMLEIMAKCCQRRPAFHSLSDVKVSRQIPCFVKNQI
jgi:hypothetical protein